jgi:hypothetical protein
MIEVGLDQTIDFSPVGCTDRFARLKGQREQRLLLRRCPRPSGRTWRLVACCERDYAFLARRVYVDNIALYHESLAGIESAGSSHNPFKKRKKFKQQSFLQNERPGAVPFRPTGEISYF